MNLYLQMLLPVTGGFLLDLALGDPVWPYHPVRLMGRLIERLEPIIRRSLPGTKPFERLGGGILAVLVILVSTVIPAGILLLAYRLFFPLGLLLETFFCYQLLAARSLQVESDRVYQALETGGVEEGRRAVSRIVGRDTQSLTEEGVVKAAVETVAENTSDGVVAPLFYLMLFGAAGGFFYKSVNTMDSMIGYRNDRYQYFGTAAARLDDVVNYVPARLSALFMLAAAFLTGKGGRRAWKIYRRDRRRHKSPNAGQTEAVMAGALGVELAGDAWYFGKLHRKPTLGDPVRPIEPEDIRRAGKLMYLTAALALAGFLALKVTVLIIWF